MQPRISVEDFNCGPEIQDRAKAICHATAACQLTPKY
jgi:hypothetical protein